MPRLSPFTTDAELSSVLVEETSKSEQSQIFHLVTIELPAPNNEMNLVDNNYDIKFKGITYTAFPIKFEGVSISTNGSVESASLALSNVSREIMYYIEAFNGLSGSRVKVKTVYAIAVDDIYTIEEDGSTTTEVNPDADPTAYIEDEYIIGSYNAKDQVAAFKLDPIIDLEIKIPRRRYMVDSCYWKFKDPSSCKYPVEGEATTCTKSLANCKSLGNETNFGGFPGISGSRRIFL